MNPDYNLMLIAWLGVAAWVSFVIFSNKKIHPKALFVLFMVELWERFSYYGMRALLILYMTADIIDGGFKFDDAKSYGIYGAYGALVYLTPLIGGYFADKLMGFRKAISMGAILMAIGQFTLFMNNQTTFYLGLALLVVGNGFFKPNISSMVGRFYAEGDKRRDGAFTLFYMGINMGAFLAPLTCGAIGENEGWQYGFLAAGIGMLVGYLVFLWGQKQGIYENIGIGPDEEVKKPVVSFIPNKILPFVATAIMVGLAWILIIQNDFVDKLLTALAVGVIGFLLYQASKMEKVAKQRIWVIVILLMFTTVFWTFFELAGSALSLFTARNINRELFGLEIKTTFFQSFNPLFIMAFAPIFSWIWIKLSNAGKEPSAPYKFGVGLALLGLGFLVLKFGGASAKGGMLPAMFMVLLYLLHTIGELVLSPVGLSLVTKLSPKQMVGFMFGIWFLSSSIAHQAGKHIAKLTTVSEKTILSSKEFQNSDVEPIFKKLISQKENLDFIEEKPTSKLITSDDFISSLSSLSGKTYNRSTVVIEEIEQEAEKYTGKKREEIIGSATVSYLVEGESTTLRVANKEEYEKLLVGTPSESIDNYIKNQSLFKGLNVFGLLGMFAIGCGALLFLLGPIISKWMHGIK
jgi:proton-dependent oligopeptide transporter, POT family